MKFTSVLFGLCCLFSIAGAQWCEEALHAQAAPTPARAALEQMSQAERKNSCISVEFESSDSEAVLLGREVERLWNGGQYDEALAQLGNLEARVGHVAIGNSWRKPVPTIETGLWGRDVRIGNRDSMLGLSFAREPSSGNLFVVLRHGVVGPHFSVCMSANGGATWHETYTWSGTAPTSLDAAVLANRLYVVYNSPEDDAQHVRLRRFLCSNGVADTFRGGGTSVVPCTLAVGDTMKEVSLVSNPNNNRLYIVALVSDGSVMVSVDDANAVSWTVRPTGITSGARSGLDATEDQRSDTANLFFSYYDVSDTLRIYGGFGQPLSLPAGNGTTTSISASLDTLICAYEDETSSPHRVRYLLSYDGGQTGTDGMLGDSGVAADAPAVTVRGGGAAVFRQNSTTPELRFRQHTDSVPWSDPVSIAEHGPSNSRPGIVYLGAGVYGVVYLSNTSPVVRGAFFDRSDWVYGIAEQRRLTTDEGILSVTPNPLKGRGWLTYALDRNCDLRVQVYDHTGRVVRTLLDGHSAGGRQSLGLDATGMAPGIYFVRADAGDRALTVPVIIVK